MSSIVNPVENHLTSFLMNISHALGREGSKSNLHSFAIASTVQQQHHLNQMQHEDEDWYLSGTYYRSSLTLVGKCSSTPFKARCNTTCPLCKGLTFSFIRGI